MPLFRQVELFLDNTYESSENKDFFPKTRCLCNFLERRLGKLKFSSKYSRINIYISKDKERCKVTPLKGVAILGVTVHLDIENISKLDHHAIHKLCIDVIERGFKSAQSYMPIPRLESMRIMECFVENGYKNEWLHEKKEWKRDNLTCEIVASLTTTEFKLALRIYVDQELLLTKTIVTSSPRELVFYKFLGNLYRTKSGKIEYKTKREVIMEFNLENLEKISG